MNKDNLLKKTYVANKNNDKYCFHDLKLTTRTDVGPTVNPVDPCWKYVIVASFCAAPPDLAFFRFLAGIIEFVFEVEQKTSWEELTLDTVLKKSQKSALAISKSALDFSLTQNMV